MKEQIPLKLVDKTTIRKEKNTWYTHLICIFLRILLGCILIFYESNISNKMKSTILILMILIIIIFSHKFIVNSDTWKVYLRTSVSYSLASILLYKNKSKESGLVIITDALMGLQSRHNAVLFNVMNKQ